MPKTKKQVQVKLRIPHILVDVRDADPALVEALLPGLEVLEDQARIHILGKGAKSLPHVFSTEEAMEEAHMWLVLGEKLPKELNMALERGIVPILLRGLHPHAQDYVPSQEKGNSFLFPKLSAWSVYGCLVRALENFHFSYDWENLKTHSKELL